MDAPFTNLQPHKYSETPTGGPIPAVMLNGLSDRTSQGRAISMFCLILDSSICRSVSGHSVGAWEACVSPAEDNLSLFNSLMMTSSNGNIFRVTDPLYGKFTGPGEFPAQRPVTRSFDVFFDLRPNKRLSKQPWGWWFETSSRSLWRQCNESIPCISTQFPVSTHNKNQATNMCILAYVCGGIVVNYDFRAKMIST